MLPRLVSRSFPIALGMIALLGGVFFGFGWFLHLAGLDTTNCGGNSAALAIVSRYSVAAFMEVQDHPSQGFQLATASPDFFRQVRGSWHPSWLHFLVSTRPMAARSGKREVIIVCTIPFNNVPRRWPIRAPYTHAVGYSDGAHGLISRAEFAALDRSAFRPLEELLTERAVDEARSPSAAPEAFAEPPSP